MGMAAAQEKNEVTDPGVRTSSGLISNLTADLIAISSSVVAGAFTAWSQIESMAYRNMSALDAFEYMKPQRKAEREKIEHELREGLITPKESFRKLDDLIERNEKDAVRRMEEFGIVSIKDRWNILRRHQKVEAMTWAMVAAGVAIGSILPLTRELNIQAAEEKKESKPER